MRGAVSRKTSLSESSPTQATKRALPARTPLRQCRPTPHGQVRGAPSTSFFRSRTRAQRALPAPEEAVVDPLHRACEYRRVFVLRDWLHASSVAASNNLLRARGLSICPGDELLEVRTQGPRSIATTRQRPAQSACTSSSTPNVLIKAVPTSRCNRTEPWSGKPARPLRATPADRRTAAPCACRLPE
jgi:hypothetical protein